MADKSGGKLLFNPFDVVDDASASLDDFDPEIRMIFKRILKKEVATRIRGLQEFCQWLEGCDEASFLQIRSQFVKIYTCGVVDEERSIRELVNSCMQVVVAKKEKRWLSPVVMDLLYPWIGSLSDSSPPVARAAKHSFDLCFGRSRYADVCRIAASKVIIMAIEIIHGTSAIATSHAYQAITFILSNSDSETLSKIKSNVDLHPDLLKANGSTKVAAYRFLAVAIEKKFVLKNQILTFPFFKILLMDLKCPVAKEAILLLSCFDEYTDEMIKQVCDVIKASLASEIPKSEIPQLSSLLKRLPSQARTNAIWLVIMESKIFDSSRLLSIWRLFATCCLETITPESVYCKKLLSPGTIEDDIRSEVLSTLLSSNKHILGSAYDAMMNDEVIDPFYKIKVALDVSSCPDDDHLQSSSIIDPNKLECLMRSLSVEEQTEIIKRLLNSSVSHPWHKLLVDAAAPQVDLASIIMANLSISRENHQYAVNKMLTQLSKMKDVGERANVLASLSSQDGVSIEFAVDQESALYALEHLSPENASVVMRHFGRAYSGKSVETIQSLLTIAKNAITTNDSEKIQSFLLFSSLLENRFEKDSFDRECLVKSIDFLFETDDSSVRPRLASGILALDHKLVDRILCKFHQTYPNILKKMEEHVSSKSIALSSYTLLINLDVEKGTFWSDGTDFIDLLYALLSYSNDKRDDILLFNSFVTCLREERQYQQDVQDARVLPSLLPLPQSIETIDAGKRGFFIVMARELGVSISLSKLLTPECPLAFALLRMQARGADDEQLLNDPSRDQLIKLMASNYAWSKDEYYQLLASLASSLDIRSLVEGQQHVNVAILAEFIYSAFKRGGLDKEEYWNQHEGLINTLLSKLDKLWQAPLERHKYHVVILSLLRLFELPTVKNTIDRRLDLLFRGFKSFVTNDPKPVLRPVLNMLADIFKGITNPKLLLQFISNEELVDLMLRGNFLVGKYTCRNFCLARLDDIIETARLHLDKCQEGDALEALLIPIPSLIATLKTIYTNQQSSINRLLGLDLFLSLAEGCREEYCLFNAYADYFREHLADRHLNYLTSCLHWASDEPLDLCKLEFTVLHFDNVASGGQGETFEQIYAANLLYRCYKTFPHVIRSWFGALSKEFSIRVLKHSMLYLSPLLIERELARIRKASLDPIKLRVIQSSTTCSVQVNYHLEEFQLSYSLSIPPSYPLKPVTVEGSDQQQRLGISEAKWRAWLLSVQSLLSQNLAIIDAIRQWKSNAEKVLQGVEPCSVCYCVLQPSDKSLPGPSCKTCRNKFHSICLYRWFKTSGQATCPMCRSLY